MTRRKIVLACVALLLGAAAVALPLLVKQTAERKLPAYLASAGIDARWQTMSIGWGDRVTLSEVVVEDSDHGLNLSIERLVVRIALRSIFSDTPRIQGVSLDGVIVELDLARRSAAALEEAPADAVDGAQPRAGGSGRLARLLEHLPDIDAREVNIRLRRGEQQLATIEVPAAKLESAGAHWRFDAAGELTLAALARFENFAPKVSWHAVGALDPLARSLEAHVSGPELTDPLIDWVVPGLGAVSLDAIALEVRTSGAIRLDVQQFQTQLPAVEEPTIELSVASARAVFEPGRGLRLDVVDPRLAVVPGELATLRQTFGLLRGLDASADDDADDDAPTSAKPSLRKRLLAAAWQAELGVRGATFGVKIRHDNAPSQEITVVESLDLAASHGRVKARGRSAGGAIYAEAAFMPDQLLPHFASLQARDVRIEELPGMGAGRAAPSRGIHGSLGGVLDINVALYTPLLGPTSRFSIEPVYLGGAISWRDGRIDISGLSAEPLTGIELGLDMHLLWQPIFGRLTLTNSEVRSGPLAVKLDAQLADWPLAPVVSLDARIDESPCQDLVRALPKQLLGPYHRVEFEGVVAPRLRVRLPLNQPRGLSVRLEGFDEMPCSVTALKVGRDHWPDVTFGTAKARVPKLVDIFALDDDDAPARPSSAAPEPHDLNEPLSAAQRAVILSGVEWLNYPFIKRVTEGVSEEAEVDVGPGTSSYIPIGELPAYVGATMYLTEEMMFYTNRGVSFSLVQKALRLNLEKERYVYGGSTVTQQLVKNLFLTRQKTLDRKVQEALISWRIDEAVSKRRVLELYLNCIEFAPDVYGIGPAARFYFNKDARQLTPLEAVFLATLKPSPWVGPRFMRRKRTPEGGWWGNRLEEIFDRLVERKYLTREEADAQRPYVVVWE
ncbi:MAG: transglycosylase domain-containing protein [Bradymonadaceae bacterium]|nr:transglycosylase domain-containing protein [Lujinxingiaceae bacterium]